MSKVTAHETLQFPAKNLAWQWDLHHLEPTLPLCIGTDCAAHHPSRNLWPAKAAKIEGQPLQTPQALWEKQKDVLKDAMKTVMGPLPQNL